MSVIPGSNGWPVVGHLPHMLRDFKRCSGNVHVARYGEVSRFGQGFIHRGVLVVGPDNWKQVLIDKDRNFSSKMGYEKAVAPFYGRGLASARF